MKQQKLNYLGTLEFKKDEQLKERLGRGKVLTHISLFTGCGGIDIGFAHAGIKTRVMLEYSEYPCETLRHNFLWKYLKERKDHEGKLCWKTKKQMRKDITWYHYPEPVIMERDIKEVRTKELLEAARLDVGQCSIISGGFPCQGFSAAGKRVIDDPRNALYKEFVRIVNEAKPLRIIVENVPGLVSMAKGEIIKQICEDFANCGYDIAWKILNAADFGVPQNRKRVIIIGHRVDQMTLKEDGSMQIFIASTPGKVTHPQMFYDRLKKWNKTKNAPNTNKKKD